MSAICEEKSVEAGNRIYPQQVVWSCISTGRMTRGTLGVVKGAF